jgi:hypothetical protein
MDNKVKLIYIRYLHRYSDNEEAFFNHKARYMSAVAYTRGITPADFIAARNLIKKGQQQCHR